MLSLLTRCIFRGVGFFIPAIRQPPRIFTEYLFPMRNSPRKGTIDMRPVKLAALSLATLLSATSLYATAASDTPEPTANDGNSQTNPSAPEDIHSNGATVPKGTQGNTTNNDGSTPSGSKPSGSKQSNDSGTSSGAGEG
jgi:hypothetical protein